MRRHCDNVEAHLSWITSDARRILAARALRSFSDGYVVITLGVYLSQLGLNTAVIGLILTAGRRR